MATSELQPTAVQLEDRVTRIQAELAAKEREALEVIKEDLCHWLADVLQLKISGHTFLDTLDTGVALCRLATLVQQSAKTAGERVRKSEIINIPMEVVNCNKKAERGSFFARDNTSNFIHWCRNLGVEEAVIFESEGLVLHKDEKRVILSLLDVARYAEQVGISPPQLVRMEKEIESLETRVAESYGETPSPSSSEETESTEPPTVKNQDLAETHPITEAMVSPPASGEEFQPVNLRVPRKQSHSHPKKPKEKAAEQETTETILNESGSERSRDEEAEPGTEGTELGPPQPKKRKRERNKREETKQEESVEEKVMRKLNECSCKEKLKSKQCGHGKFIIQPSTRDKKTTLYARLLSDRVMVRVGGGWDTLDHFLLKHDPCRIHAIAVSHRRLAQREGTSTSVATQGKHKRED